MELEREDGGEGVDGGALGGGAALPAVAVDVDGEPAAEIPAVGEVGGFEVGAFLALAVTEEDVDVAGEFRISD